MAQLALATIFNVCFNHPVHRVIVITGTDTGVGKTVLTGLLARYLLVNGNSVAALKPISSGGRADARELHRALGGALTLDEINPWHFRGPLAPLLAARMDKRAVTLREVVAHVHAMANRFETVLVEGAGGLLSPLGEGISTRELIGALGAEVFVVARNQLGAVNHLRLTLEALPPLTRGRARIAWMSPKKRNPVSRTNPALLAEFIGPAHTAVLPHFPRMARAEQMLAIAKVRPALEALLH